MNYVDCIKSQYTNAFCQRTFRNCKELLLSILILISYRFLLRTYITINNIKSIEREMKDICSLFIVVELRPIMALQLSHGTDLSTHTRVQASKLRG